MKEVIHIASEYTENRNHILIDGEELSPIELDIPPVDDSQLAGDLKTQLCKLPNDDVSLFNDFYREHFPHPMDKRGVCREVNRQGYIPEVKFTNLTVKQKNRYIKIFNRYIRRKKWRDLEIKSLTYYLTPFFTVEGGPRIVKKVSFFTKVTYYAMFQWHKFKKKHNIQWRVSPDEIKAISYMMSGKLIPDVGLMGNAE